MGAVDSKGEGSYKARFDATKKMYDYGFGQYTTEKLVSKDETFKGNKTIAVKNGKEETVKIAAKDDFSMMLKTAEADDYKVKVVLDKKSLEAPAKKGTVVGHLEIKNSAGKDYGFIDGSTKKLNIVTTEAAEEKGWFTKLFSSIGDFFSGLWNKIF